MRNNLIIFLLIVISHLAYSQGINNVQIKGTINSATDKTIQIGGNTIPVSETGEFTFTAKIKSPVLYEVNYDRLNWTIYLEPNSQTELKFSAGDLSSLEYKGKLIVPNNYLKKTSLITKSIYDFFNKNGVQLCKKDEAGFISAIDSLKKLYLYPLSAGREGNEKLSEDFIKLFKANVNFWFNYYVTIYPENHLNLTNEKVILSKTAVDYINSKAIDNIEMLDLSSYKRFCKSWIDYNADMLAIKNTEQKNYNLKKMDAVFEYLPEIFTHHELLDYWLSEYLSEYIQNNGIANSEKYTKDFYANCKIEEYATRIKKLCSSILEGQKDHIVKIYKCANGFNLEAHIFYPEGIKKGEKRPAITVFHGGGWSMGNVSWAFGAAKNYANQGMIGIAVQYRLSNQKDISPIDAMQDAKDLMIWLRINSDSLGIIKDKIAASGWSAGGHLIASSAIFADTLPDKKINSVPNALLLTSPAVDLGHENWFIQLLKQKSVDPFSLSPVDHIFKGLPPTIILQGREDHVAPLKGVQLFHDKMLANGNYCEIWIYDKVGHLFTPSYLDDTRYTQPDKEIQKQADIKSIEFLKKFGFISK
jgi:acetyl esterase